MRRLKVTRYCGGDGKKMTKSESDPAPRSNPTATAVDNCLLQQPTRDQSSLQEPSRMFRSVIASGSRSTGVAQMGRSLLPIRSLHVSCNVQKSFNQPRPPPLPKADQEEFDALIKANQTVGASPLATAPQDELQHRDLRKPLKPEFEGDVNPKTGERGGPKRDPFLAGNADWQYGGRVTVSLSSAKCGGELMIVGFLNGR